MTDKQCVHKAPNKTLSVDPYKKYKRNKTCTNGTHHNPGFGLHPRDTLRDCSECCRYCGSGSLGWAGRAVNAASFQSYGNSIYGRHVERFMCSTGVASTETLTTDFEASGFTPTALVGEGCSEATVCCEVTLGGLFSSAGPATPSIQRDACWDLHRDPMRCAAPRHVPNQPTLTRRVHISPTARNKGHQDQNRDHTSARATPRSHNRSHMGEGNTEITPAINPRSLERRSYGHRRTRPRRQQKMHFSTETRERMP